MATEASPFEEEEQVEESLTENLLELLATSLIFATSNIVLSQFVPSNYQSVEQRFRSKLSEGFPLFTSVTKDSVEIALQRVETDLGIKNISVDYSNPIFSNRIVESFEKHIDFIQETNGDMFNTLRQVAIENGWSDEQLARRLRQYFGLTPKHMLSVINMENALKSDGLNLQKRNEILQKRIDQLIEWRLKLIAVQLSTEVVEGSKDAFYTYAADTNQIDRTEYEKNWNSVIDNVTTQICISSHNTRAPIGGRFPNGLRHPPAYPPVHECRSAITLVKRIL